MRFTLLLFLIIAPLLGGRYEEKLAVLYDSLNPNSLTEQFAFYSLYPETLSGKEALGKSLELINKHRKYPISLDNSFSLPDIKIEPIIALVTKQSYETLPSLSKTELQMIQKISNHLSHYKLKGHLIKQTSELEALDSADVDLARAIFLYQFGEENLDKVETYEAYLDMMALQILAKLPKNPTFLEKQEAMNQFIFHEMCYRFPPHSMWAKDVDLYTFLPSVLDGRHGVCLGVSILYLSLAQRINLPLDIITPPGHIFLSYQQEGKKINIETTARGIHTPDEAYLGINTKSLHKRTMKEVIGLNFMNAGATAWQMGKHEEAVKIYKEAEKFVPGYNLNQIFLGYNLLFLGKIEEATAYLKKAADQPLFEAVYPDTVVYDFLAGKATPEAIKAIYSHVDETRDSILQKQKELELIVKENPEFREGLFHLAVTWLQLGHSKEALEILEKYHQLDPNNPTVEYYLTLLSTKRYKYAEAKTHFAKLNEILNKQGHVPKALKELKESMRTSIPL